MKNYDYTENIQSNIEEAMMLYGEAKVVENLYTHMNYIIKKINGALFSDVYGYFQNTLSVESAQILTTLIIGKSCRASSSALCFDDLIKYFTTGGKL